MRLFVRYSALMALIIALYSCDGGVKYADKYGFLPGNDALANSEAFQRCLDGGGKIVVRKEGVYDVCRTLLLDSGTDLSFADGVILSRAKDPEGVIAKHVFLNRGALTREYDKDITITGLNIRCNDLSEDDVAKLRDYSERIAHELNLVDGILHIQYIERADGTPIIIEICRRSPGDLYIKFVKYATGIDYPKFIVMAETGEDISSIVDAPTQGFWLRHCVMAGRNIENNSVVRDVAFAPEIQENIVEKFLWHKPGEIITDKSLYKAGIVFFKFDTLAEMQDKTAQMTDFVKIVVD